MGAFYIKQKDPTRSWPSEGEFIDYIQSLLYNLVRVEVSSWGDLLFTSWANIRARELVQSLINHSWTIEITNRFFEEHRSRHFFVLLHINRKTFHKFAENNVKTRINSLQ